MHTKSALIKFVPALLVLLVITSSAEVELQADSLAQVDRILDQAKEALDSKSYDLALRYSRAAEVLAPSNALVWIQRVSILTAKGDISEALSTAQKALEFTPSYILYADILVRSGNTNEAFRVLQAGLEDERSEEHTLRPHIMAKLAEMYYDTQNYEKAMAITEEAMIITPLFNKDLTKSLEELKKKCALKCK